MAKLPGLGVDDIRASNDDITSDVSMSRVVRVVTESFINVKTKYTRGRLYVGGGNTASFHAIAAVGDPTGYQIDFYSSNDGNNIPVGRAALASLDEATMMSADVDVGGCAWVVWEVSAVAVTSDPCLVNLELTVKTTG